MQGSNQALIARIWISQDLSSTQRMKTCHVDKKNCLVRVTILIESNWFDLLSICCAMTSGEVPSNRITKKHADHMNSDVSLWDKSQRMKSAFDLGLDPEEVWVLPNGSLVIFPGISGCYPFQDLTLDETEDSFTRNTWSVLILPQGFVVSRTSIWIIIILLKLISVLIYIYTRYCQHECHSRCCNFVFRSTKCHWCIWAG